MFKLFKNLGKKELLMAFICLLLIFGQVWLELKMPDYMSEITVLVQSEGSQMNDILRNGAYMIACALGSLVSAIIVGYIAATISATLSMKVRKKLFDKVENLAMHEVKQFSTSSLITRTTNDITQIEMLVAMGLQLLLKAPITAVWAITKILDKSWQWSAITAVAVTILLTTVGTLIAIVLPRFKVVQKLIDKINGITRENLTGIRVIRAFNAESYQQEKFENVNNDLTSLQLFNQKSFAILSPIMYLVMYFLTLSIYFVGAILIKDALMVDKLALFGNMVVFSSYAMQIIMSFLMLAMIFMMLPRAQVSANRINEVLDTEISIKEGTLDKDTTNERGTVEFKNVSFKYPDAEEYLLRNISFKAEKGQTVAFIGSTGSGKSTLINLIPRFYDATEGEVLVDGVNVKEYKSEFLHNKIGYVSQKAVMFNGTVASNVAYGDNGKPELTEEQIDKVCETVGLSHFIKTLPHGYETEVSDNDNLSAGQKQLLTIARAMLQDAPFLILDEATSNVDTRTEELVQKAMDKLTEGRTSFIIAHRLSTIKNADLILVMDHGDIVEQGTHEELLAKGGFYEKLYNSQFEDCIDEVE